MAGSACVVEIGLQLSSSARHKLQYVGLAPLRPSMRHKSQAHR